MKIKPEVILWDFDGVIMESNAIRDLGFQEVLKDFPKSEVEKLMDFHKSNGGLSRYVKFRYFFEEVRGEPIGEKAVQQWADKFSQIMMRLLINEDLLIPEITEFIKENHHRLKMHIVSGSDQDELREICSRLGINQYFKSIHGSPKPKKEWVKTIINSENYHPSVCVLIGDSINDYEAARENGIKFCAYNNSAVEEFSQFSFKEFLQH